MVDHAASGDAAATVAGMNRHPFQTDIDAVGRIDAVASILEVLCRTTGMGFAAVARVTEDYWITCQVRDEIGFGLRPGDELQVQTTLCREVRDASRPIIIEHVTEDAAYRRHPTPAMYGFQSYVSMPIIRKSGEFFGTLCAIDPKPVRVNTPETIGMFRLFAELIAFHLDADERLAAAEAARRSDELMGGVLAATPDCVKVLSADGTIEFINARGVELTELGAASDVIGHDFAAGWPEGARAAIRQAIEQAAAGYISRIEGFCPTAKGTPRWWEVSFAPFQPASNDTSRPKIVSVSRDITERRAAEAALREREERLRLIVENVRDYAIFTTDAQGRVETWLPGAAAVFGWSAEEIIGLPSAVLFTPVDQERGVPQQELETARREGVAPNVRWHLRKDGSRAFIEGSVTALHDPDGTFQGYLKIGQDVTDRKASDERQELLMREVDHRAKNALAVVQSVVRLTPARDPATFKSAVEGRILALARAQTLLSEDRWNGADLRVLLAGELAPFLGSRRADLRGPSVTLPPGAAQPMAMAFHELATNAVKYGALSLEAGHLSVSWRLEQRSGGGPQLKLRWVETGVGLIADTPDHQGFGSRLLEGAVRGQLGGTVTLSWEASGLVCEVEVPLVQTSEAAKARNGSAMR
ncbi:PAS domain-containing protein [Roseomonas sp. GCM10028921]